MAAVNNEESFLPPVVIEMCKTVAKKLGLKREAQVVKIAEATEKKGLCGLNEQTLLDLTDIFGTKEQFKNLRRYLAVLPNDYPLDEFTEKYTDLNMEFSVELQNERAHKLSKLFLKKLGRFPDSDEMELLIDVPRGIVKKILDRSIIEKNEPICIYRQYFPKEFERGFPKKINKEL